MTGLSPGTQLIYDLVSSGRITPEDGARLIEFRRRLAYARKPWWERAVRFAWRVVFG